MPQQFIHNRIYFVTCENLSLGRSDEEMVEAILSGGVRVVQFRDKNSPRDILLQKAIRLRKITSHYQAILIINDDPELALEVGADGVHLGQEDLPVKEVRKMQYHYRHYRNSRNFLIGLSTHNRMEVEAALNLPVDYINLGPVFPTETKENHYPPLVKIGKDGSHDFTSLQEMIHLCQKQNFPFSVMGGIKQDHLFPLAELGVTHFAMVTALTLHPNPRQQASHLIDMAERATNKTSTERKENKPSQEVGA